ncbi:MAG: signal recognition particle protein Srp19 [Candidatus Lokiarchaeota archaeon]|nr:signal recognition particle protein Srp19 [Candidatus Lokiarchaeota archaeon]
MRSRKPYTIIWPQYFDLKRSKAQGRRIPKKFALEKVSATEIVTLAKKLGYEAQYEKGYKYPKSWWDEPGRVVIDTKGKSKSKILIELAKELKKVETKR